MPTSDPPDAPAAAGTPARQRGSYVRNGPNPAEAVDRTAMLLDPLFGRADGH